MTPWRDLPPREQAIRFVSYLLAGNADQETAEARLKHLADEMRRTGLRVLDIIDAETCNAGRFGNHAP
jgi:hypothetical protein